MANRQRLNSMIRLNKHTKQILIIIAVLICVCAVQSCYIDMSASVLMEKTDIIIDRIKKGDNDSALINIKQMQEMWDKSSKNWQSLYDHGLVGKIFENLYLTLRFAEEGNSTLALSYATQLKYAIWDICYLEKTAFENIF